MGETIAVLFIFFILLAVGMAFWFKYKQVSVAEDIDLGKIESGIRLTQVVSFLPEVQCTRNNIVVDNCFDYHKLMALHWLNMKTVEGEPNPLYNDQDEYYYDIFGPAFIYIEQIYPKSTSKILLYNKTLDRVSKERVQVPVTIYHPIKNEHYFGVLTVDSYG